MKCPEELRVQAYFDGELDALAAAATERHVAACATCRALLADLGRLRAAIREELTVTAPAALRERLGRALDTEDRPAAAAAPQRARGMPGRRPFWLGALSGVLGTALAAGLVFMVFAALPGNALVDELVNAHLRSLMPQHLIEVESSDHHTVKPWFAGHADVSPVVEDFAADGFRLVGGRADYLDRQRAAVVVYQHGAHLINVFSWADAGKRLSRRTTRNGYHLLFWSENDVQYCAVSDTSWGELQRLATLLQNQGALQRAP